MYASKTRDIPWSIWNCAKFLLMFLLIVLNITEVGFVLFSEISQDHAINDVFSPLCRLLTYVSITKCSGLQRGRSRSQKVTKNDKHILVSVPCLINYIFQ